MKKSLIALSILVSWAGGVSATDLYDASQSYSQGQQVEFGGSIYEAQWWANPNESPANVTDNAWESPWVFVSSIDTTENEFLPSQQQAYVRELNSLADKMVERVKELRSFASNPDYYFYKDDGNKYVELNNIHYKVLDNGNLFIPLRNFSDTSALVTLFPFFDQNWEFSQYDGGAVIVNKIWGNYDWGNGCLLEYSPFNFFDTGNIYKETATCFDGSEPESSAEQVNYFHPAHFGINADYSNLAALVKNQNQLIIAHNAKAGTEQFSPTQVAMYDTVTKEKFILTGIHENQQYRAIDDIALLGNLLYISAISAHQRIDVLDLTTKEYLYSLDVKSSNLGKIAVSDKHIFVTTDNAVQAYEKPQDASAIVNHLQPVATLPYEGAAPHNLKVHSNKLIAASSNFVHVFDLAQLETQTHLSPMHSQALGSTAMDVNDEYFVFVEAKRVSFHHVKDVVANGFVFKEANKAVYLADGSTQKGNDIVATDVGYITLSDNVIRDVHTLDTLTFTPKASVETRQLQFNELPFQSKRTILQDGLTEGTWSIKLNVNAMIEARLIGNQVFINNYTEFDATDVDLDIKIDGQNQWAKLGILDHLPAYTRISLPLSFFNENLAFNAVDESGVFNYTGVLRTLSGDHHLDFDTQNLFRSRFDTSSTESGLQKLKSIDLDWAIEFADTNFIYNDNKAWEATEIKNWLKLMSNVAYAMSSSKFEHHWLNFKSVYGYEMKNVEGHLGEFDQETYESYLASMRYNKFTLLRKTSGYQPHLGVSGQRGSTFGMSDEEFSRITNGDLKYFASYLGDQINKVYVGGCSPFPCNEIHYFKDHNHGFVPMFVDVMTQLVSEKDLPYL